MMRVSDTRPSAKSNPLSCGKWQVYKTIDESRLRAHMRDNHHICDLCDITFDTPIDLREHNKYIVDTPIDLREHNKAPKETAYSCDECGIEQRSPEKA